MTKPEDLKLSKILILDTLQLDKTSVAVYNCGKLTLIEKQVRAQELNQLILEVLKKTKLSIEQIDLAAVLTGDGSFTGSRMGITTANTIGFLQNIKTLELNCQTIDSGIRLIDSGLLKGAKFVEPRY